MDSSNTVNGKPVCYLVNQHDITVQADVGYVALVNCTNMVVENLHISNNVNGLLFAYTQNSAVTCNTFEGNCEGIKLVGCFGNVLSENNMCGNGYNFWVSGSFDNNVDVTNTVDGKPVYYWISQQGKTVPSNAGYIALINCVGITVQNLTLSNNTVREYWQ